VTAAEFDKLLATRLDKTRATLATKAGEYATDGDRLHNFHTAALCVRRGAAEVCNGFALKHWVSIRDMLDAHIEAVTNLGRYRSADDRVDEKIGDAICYLVLLEALLKEPS
jgi:hypothetical protein